MTRTCSDCPKPISRESKGRCRSCAMKEVSSRAGLMAERIEKSRAARRDPAFKARHRAATLAGKRRSMEKPGMREKLQRIGRETGERNFWRNGDAEARAAGRLAIKRAYRSWCPEEVWDLNDKMKATSIPLAERKRIILEQVAGTPEHGRRVVANNIDAQRIRHERDVAQSY